VFIAFESDHSNVFSSVILGCRSRLNSAPEVDGLDDLASDPEQAMFDLRVERDGRREKQGYMSPALLLRYSTPRVASSVAGSPATGAFSSGSSKLGFVPEILVNSWLWASTAVLPFRGRSASPSYTTK